MADEDAGTLTPPSADVRKQRPASRMLQSPIPQHQRSPFHLLGSNDDQMERAQARAARAAASRRKSLGLHNKPRVSSSDDSNLFFGKEQIMELFQNCIKLASENKINQKNTWELSLIDHLSEIIRVESEDDAETNFQKASCTLEAGVKIYSLRVDSVHSEAYKVLGGINRAGREDDKENLMERDQINDGQEELPKKELGRKMSPLSTLESSFDALNVKKFDVAFTVDPLYHQTSAQFDEGGAKGLLLNNLGVYGSCRVLFDSNEAPGKSMPCEAPNEISELIDLSFAREYIEQMITCMPAKTDISPTLRDIVNRFDEDNQRPSNGLSSAQKVAGQDDVDSNQTEFENNAFDDCGSWNFDHDDQTSVVDDSSSCINPDFMGHQEESYGYTFRETDIDDRFEKIAGFLSLGLGFTSKINAWAGPEHWKYQKIKGSEKVPVSTSESSLVTKKMKNAKLGASDVDFTKSLDKEMTDIFAPPKNLKSLLLPAKRVPCNITLPEDCHYRPESLVKLFILPDVMCLGKKGRKSFDDSRQQSQNCNPDTSWDDDSITNDQFDDGNVHSDVEDECTLVSQPRQVNKIDVQYDKSSKQVDVHALKERLWNHISGSIGTPTTGGESVASFRELLSCIADDNSPRSSSLKDEVSTHLCFICLLHLANEHCLSIHGHPSLDELDIHVPHAAITKLL